ncbi:hypothetical protein ACN2WE_40905, partial [Streptomyces sp. cg28]|uniref:hypothetical protein n=1 Tax=Streptomyces sp. cg28 TaxID=3403457 RepID=UPI003B21D5A6
PSKTLCVKPVGQMNSGLRTYHPRALVNLGAGVSVVCHFGARIIAGLSPYTPSVLDVSDPGNRLNDAGNLQNSKRARGFIHE